MKLTLRGVEYQADLPDLYVVSITEARTIKANTRMTIQDWRIGLMTFVREDPDILAALVYLLWHRARKPDDPEIDWREIGTVTSKEIAQGVAWEDSDTEAVKAARAEMDTMVDDAAERLLRDDDQPSDPGGTPEGAGREDNSTTT